MTPAQAQALVLEMTAALPKEWSFLTREQQNATQKQYRRFLVDLPFEAAYTAVHELIGTAKTMPTIADIRAATARVQLGNVRAGGEAWGSVMRAMAAEGSRRKPGRDFRFKDPIVARCVDALGWVALCTTENQTADRARFIELYDRLAREQRSEEVIATLPAVRRFRELQATNQAALPAAPDVGDTLGATNARSEQNGPQRVDFNRFIPERTENRGD